MALAGLKVKVVGQGQTNAAGPTSMEGSFFQVSTEFRHSSCALSSNFVSYTYFTELST